MAQLLRELEIRPDRVVVELNLQILDHQDFERRPLGEGDRVEIISFIGGGSEELNDCAIVPMSDFNESMCQ